MFVANQIRKTWGHENGDISGTMSWNDLIFDAIFLRGCPNYRWHISIGIIAPLQCHLHQHLHSDGSFGQQEGKIVIQTT